MFPRFVTARLIVEIDSSFKTLLVTRAKMLARCPVLATSDTTITSPWREEVALISGDFISKSCDLQFSGAEGVVSTVWVGIVFLRRWK